MTERFLNWLKARGSYRMITRDGAPYLERYILFKSKRGSIYLHRFWASDPDEIHDHPWWSFSFILKGRYMEFFADGTWKMRLAGSRILRDAVSFHRIELAEGDAPGSAWTLFFTGPKVRQWGFFNKQGQWESARDYSRQDVEVKGRDFTYKGTIFPKVRMLK